MENYLHILNSVPVYRKHEENSKTSIYLEPNSIIKFNREKRRNKINWYEVYLKNNEVAYIKKDDRLNFVCSFCKISDIESVGFYYSKFDEKTSNNEIFYSFDGFSSSENSGFIALKAVEDNDKKTTTTATVKFDRTKIITEIVTFKKDEGFYLIRPKDYKSKLIEVDNFKGKKGILLAKTNYNEVGDIWIKYVAILLMAITILGIIGAFLANGWLVISGLMIIPALIVAAIGIFTIQIIIMIVKGIFNQIYKRL